MATRRPKVKPDAVKHTCGECGCAAWIEEQWNKALDGSWICVRCPYVTNRAMIRNEKACEHFKLKR